ncbi:MAG: ATP-dependent Clp protease ATP-binding subunit [Anaerolineae bacterium]|nr:ATP-dependent Clp protease ATP-binding subunit [Anaerolineae bacterium]
MSPPEISEQEIRDRCLVLIGAATEEAVRLHHDYIGVEHLYIALTQIDGGMAQRLLISAGLDPRTVRNEIRREVGTSDAELSFTGDELPLTPRAHHILAVSVTLADEHGEDEVLEYHLLLALLREGQSIPVRKLRSMGVDAEQWVAALKDELDVGSSDSLALPFGGSYQWLRAPAETEPRDRATTPLIDKYGRDLTALARQGKLMPVIGREREIRAVARTLTRNKKNNPLLLGDSGVGKTAVVEGLALEIVQGSAPAPLLNRRIVQIEIGTLVAGTSLRGQFEERLVGILDEARNNPAIILFIDEIHTIVGAGDTIDGNLDAANILKPALSRGEIVCIGATTHEEYRKAIAQDAALDRRFRTIEIGEPSLENTLLILQGLQGQYARHHQVHISPDALDAAVRLSSRYMTNRYQPDKALDLLDEACARVAIQVQAGTDAERTVTAAAVAEVVAEWTGIPVAQITEDERAKFNRIDQDLRTRVVGQDHAVAAVADAIKMNRAGLSDPRRPVAVFLFMGPSGVGKTELAKALAAFLFGSEEAMLRFDMSEFHDEHTVARLIGSPPGYKDSQRGGQLTEALRRRPYSVVLLDEVDKAAPEVFDIFLQAFDDGRLTDARGGTVDARHAIWIMTSNIGTPEATRGNVGFRAESASASNPGTFQAALKRFFRPELLNRIDEVIVFNPLTPEALAEILELNLRDLRARLAEQGITIELAPDARELILSQGADPVHGARPLRRTIARLLARPLSSLLLEGRYPRGTTILVSVAGARLAFEAKIPSVREG